MFGPTTPSAARLFDCWNCFTAFSELVPNIPSAGPGLNPSATRMFCKFTTGAPVDPLRIVISFGSHFILDIVDCVTGGFVVAVGLTVCG